MIKKIVSSLSCLVFLAFACGVSNAYACSKGYVEYKGTCYKKLSCKNSSTQQGNKCKCKTGWSGTLCDTAAKGYVDLGSGVLACAANYKKDSKGRCIAQPADKVGSYLVNGINNKTVTVNNTSDADVYGISTQDNVDVKVNNAYADRRDASATVKITNKGNGDVYGMANDESSGNNAYAYKGTAEGKITINNTGDGKVYGVVHDGDAESGYYNALTRRGGVALGYINITNKGKGNVLGGNNNSCAAGESAASGSIVIKNTGDGTVYGVDNTNTTARNSGVSYGSIKITNKGNGTVVGSKSSNTYLSNGGEAYGYIDIINKGNGSVYGIGDNNNGGDNASSDGYGTAYGYITINNRGNGKVTGSSGGNVNKNSGDGTAYGYITITNKGDGAVLGSGGDNIHRYNSLYGSGKMNATIKIHNTGKGKVVGATGDNVYNYSGGGKAYGVINITNKGNGRVYGVKGSGSVYNAYNTASLAVDDAVGRIKITYKGKRAAYGLYATSSDYSEYVYNTKSGTGYIDMINMISGSVYGMSGGSGRLTVKSIDGNSGKSYIKIINLGSGVGYGIDNTANTYSYNTIENVSDGANKQSLIEMVNKGDGLVVGIRGKYQAINSGEIKIHNLGSGTAVGMYVSDIYRDYSSYMMNNYNEYWHQNSGTIIIDRSQYTYDAGTTKTSDDYIYKAATATGGRAIGVYVTSGAYFLNTGSIIINDADIAYGVYAESGANVKNEGTISIDGYVDPYNAIKLNGSPLFQDGVLQANSINLNSVDGVMVASASSRFDIANDISGNLAMNNSIVENGFDTTYSVKDMIRAGDTSGLNLQSQSALFDATLENDSDAVMTMKSFNDVVENQSLADFLKQNYAAENNAELFGMLKGQETAAALNSTLDSIAGSEVFNRFNFEDMTMMRELNMDVNNKLFNDKQDYLTTSGTISPFYFDSENGGDGKYALYNHRIGKKSFGLSMAFANVNSSDRKNNNSRNDESFQMSVPFGYNTHGFKFITAPRFGYAYGHYDRDGFESRTYKGTMEKRMFGLMNEARYPIAAGKWSIAPAVEFNMLGYHLKGSEDVQDYSLNIKSQNNYSVESGIGLYANREMKPTKNSTLKLNAGVAMYHEFADPYTMELGMHNMDGSFKIRDERRKDNRAVLRTGFDYSYGDITVEGNFATFVDGTTHTQAGVDFKYNF